MKTVVRQCQLSKGCDWSSISLLLVPVILSCNHSSIMMVITKRTEQRNRAAATSLHCGMLRVDAITLSAHSSLTSERKET